MIQKYFDKVFLINLSTAKDRLAYATENCKREGVEFELVKAIPGTSPKVQFNGEGKEGWNRNAAALALTTLGIIKKAKKNKWKSVFIMEDDVNFISHNFSNILEAAMRGLPEKWDFFHLNTFHEYEPKWVSTCLVKLGGAWCCQAYGINEQVYDRYIEELSKFDKPIDQITMELHKELGASYATKPNTVIHIERNWSTLREKIVEY
jgi:GR25 family glycosyltransferase involved in LPS biosynthesis